MPLGFEQLLPAIAAVAIVVIVVLMGFVLHRHDRAQRAAELLDEAQADEREWFRIAAEQLGGEDPVQRLPAVRMLEDLAQAAPGYRQPVVDLLCACLRDVRGDGADQVVRSVAQQVLTTHLRAKDELSWGELDLDLTGAVLADVDLSQATVRTLTCRGTRFAGDTTLRGAQFLRTACFAAATFTGTLDSADVDFDQSGDFTDACFHADASFARCTFRGAARFAGATFNGSANFVGAIFLDAGVFAHPVDGPAWFRDTVDFRAACFIEAHFDDVDFPEGVDLEQAEFAHPPPPARLHPALRAALQR